MRIPSFVRLSVVTGVHEQSLEEIARRRQKPSLTKNDVVIGCPLCLSAPDPAPVATGGGDQQ
jgi:hypothetical protein